MSLFSVIKQTEEVLDEVLQIVRKDYETPRPVLCEEDRHRFIKEETSLWKQLKGPESNCSDWRGYFGLSSPQAAKCLQDAKELRQRIKVDVKEKVRMRVTGKSGRYSPSNQGQASASASETDAELPLAEDNPGPASSIITSPLDMHCSGSVDSQVNVDPSIENDRNYPSDISGPMNPSLYTSSEIHDEPRNSASPRYRRPPPPPPPLRIPPPGTSRSTLGVASDLGGNSPRRSSPLRRPPPPPPLSPRSFLSPVSPSTLDPAMASISRHSSQRQRQQRRDEYSTKTNCVNITGSNVEGLTVNNGGRNNSGAVIHKTTVPPPHLPHAVSLI